MEQLMRFRVIINGIPVECDSPADVLELTGRPIKAAQLRPIMAPKVSAPRKSQPSLKPEPKIGPMARRFLTTLKEMHPSSITTAQIAQKLGVSSKSLPPIVTGIRRWANEIKVPYHELVTYKTSFENGKPVSVYMITQEGMKRLHEMRST